MEEIDISQLISYFRSKLIYVILCISIAFCLSSIYVNQMMIPEYTSSTTVLLNQASESTSINSNDVNLNKSLITTYSEIIKSKRVLNQVIENLSLDYVYNELVSEINVSEVNDTSIIKISVTDTDNELAAVIANEIATVFTKEIVRLYNIENISTIDSAEVSKIASSTSAIKIVAISILASIVIFAGVVFIMFYFDTTLKNEEEIEKITGLPVIGIVPISREKLKLSQHRKYFEDIAKGKKREEVLPVVKEINKK